MTQRVLNDRYVLESCVGEGGMAVTYRGRDLLLNRTVAVKVLREQFTADAHFVERFRREAQSAARLSHEHIAGVYDAGEADGAYYIVMEFVEGTDLKARLRREGPLPVATVVELGRQIAAALDASHRSGLIHRDIKPHNILLTPDGKVKVTDFGIAKLVTDGEDTGVILASVHYVSPEHVQGAASSPASDLYSLGCVLFEMLTGRTVFEGENAMTVAHKQVYEAPPSPRALRPDIPPALEALVLRCLEKDPAARYTSAAELRAALSHVLARPDQDATQLLTPPPTIEHTVAVSRPVAAPAAPRPERPQPAAPQPRGGGAGAWIISLLFLVLLGVVGYGGYKVFYEKPDPRPQPSPDGTVAVPDLLSYSPDGAEELLAQYGLEGQPMEESSDSVPEGKVCRQDPEPRALVKEGDIITYWVSTGPLTFQVPDVSGMALKAAAKQIRDEGFKGKFAYKKEASDEFNLDQVIKTDPPAGTVVGRDSQMTLVLSTGSAPMVNEVYRGTVPALGEAQTVYVRVEFERPAGSEPEMMWEGTLNPGDRIPAQDFQRKPSERVVVRMLVGVDSLSQLDIHEEKTYGPAE